MAASRSSSPADPAAVLPPGRIVPCSRLDQLRGELAELAFVLERQGRRDAADVVILLQARVAELAEADERP